MGYNRPGSSLYGGSTLSPYSGQRYSPSKSIPSASTQYKGYPTTPGSFSGYSSLNVQNQNLNDFTSTPGSQYNKFLSTPTLSGKSSSKVRNENINTPYNVQSSRTPISGYNENLNKKIYTTPSYIRPDSRIGGTTIGGSNLSQGTSRPYTVPINQGYISSTGPNTNLRPNQPNDNRNVFSQPGYSTTSKPFNIPTNQGFSSTGPSTNTRQNLPIDNRNVFSQPGYTSTSRPFNVPANQGYASPTGPSTNIRQNLLIDNRNVFSQPGYTPTSRPLNVPANQGYSSPTSPNTNIRQNLPIDNRNVFSQPGYTSTSRPFNVPSNQGYASPTSPNTNKAKPA